MDLNKPLFYKSSNPQLAEIIQLATHLFYWDESANMPIEIENGEGIMSPQDIEGDYIIWSDSYTLGFTSEADSRPIFFSDGGQGADKILRMINSVANRLGVAKFADLNAALAWAASEPRIYVDGSYEAPTPVEICDPAVTMPVLGAAGPGGLNLALIQSATHTFNGYAGNNALGYFSTANLTKTYACTLEFFKSTTRIGGANWFGYADGIYSNVNRGTYELFQVGDIVYRDAYGNNFFPENHGFIILGGDGSIRERFHWVSIGANGVITSVDKMSDL